MEEHEKNVVLVFVVAAVVLVICAQVYIGYQILTKKEVPVAVEDALSGNHEGKRVLVDGYVVKYKENESVSYMLQAQESLGRMVREGIELSEGNYDPFAAYIWDGSYRTIHTEKTAIRGIIANRSIEVERAEFSQ